MMLLALEVSETLTTQSTLSSRSGSSSGVRRSLIADLEWPRGERIRIIAIAKGEMASLVLDLIYIDEGSGIYFQPSDLMPGFAKLRDGRHLCLKGT